jgi:hypothetical protein
VVVVIVVVVVFFAEVAVVVFPHLTSRIESTFAPVAKLSADHHTIRIRYIPRPDNVAHCGMNFSDSEFIFPDRIESPL